jgi:hypothetical protein
MDAHPVIVEPNDVVSTDLRSVAGNLPGSGNARGPAF